jgi:hypothetical protein
VLSRHCEVFEKTACAEFISEWRSVNYYGNTATLETVCRVSLIGFASVILLAMTGFVFPFTFQL